MEEMCLCVEVAAMMHLRPPDDWPMKSVLGTKPSAMSARERWEARMEVARERRAKRALEGDGDEH
jgi:hypothetical protein